MSIVGIYIGIFDPLMLSQLDIIKRSKQFCDTLIVAVENIAGDKPIFSIEERVKQVNIAIDENINFLSAVPMKVISFQGLLAYVIKENEVNLIIRAVSSSNDFGKELDLSNVSKIMTPGIETIFLPISQELSKISPSGIKDLCRYGSDISQFVPSNVARDLQVKFGTENKKIEDSLTG